MQALRTAITITSRRLSLCRAASANIGLPSASRRCVSTQPSPVSTPSHTGVFGLKFDVPIISAVGRQDRDLGSKASAAARGKHSNFRTKSIHTILLQLRGLFLARYMVPTKMV